MSEVVKLQLVTMNFGDRGNDFCTRFLLTGEFPLNFTKVMLNYINK